LSAWKASKSAPIATLLFDEFIEFTERYSHCVKVTKEMEERTQMLIEASERVNELVEKAEGIDLTHESRFMIVSPMEAVCFYHEKVQGLDNIEEKLKELNKKLIIENEEVIVNTDAMQTQENQRKEVKYIDLFCGLGAFHTAFNRNNILQNEVKYTCVLASDINEGVRKIYEENYGIKTRRRY